MELTYSEAIERVMMEHNNFASLQYIYENIEKYRKKTGKTPDNTIQERVQRDSRFTRIAKGIYALTEFIEGINNEDVGNFILENDEIVFKKREITEKLSKSKIRIGQNDFRTNLLKEFSCCPITKIDDKKLLIASHIKPWIHSNNDERLNPKNGFVFSPIIDKLFDKGIGLITFTNEKELLISSKLSKENINRIGLENHQIVDNLIIAGRENFLEYHRKYIFQP